MATSIKSKLLATAAATALIGLAGCASQGSGVDHSQAPMAVHPAMDKAYYNDTHKRGGMMKCSHKYSHKAKKAKKAAKAKAAATTNSNNSNS